MEVLNFYFQGESYCIDILKVSEIIASARAFPLPGAPPAFAGLIQLRGRIISLLEFSRWAGKEQEPAESQIVVFAEPFAHFALRIPAPVEAKTLDFGPPRFPEGSPRLLAILEGSSFDGERFHHLISPTQLVAEVKNLIRHWRKPLEAQIIDR